eukprot:Rhum_TRINITY_DN12237_c0_g3::Rhum_TRINITY_DN12237_c0_g3_i1::g.50366::m.50366
MCRRQGGAAERGYLTKSAVRADAVRGTVPRVDGKPVGTEAVEHQRNAAAHPRQPQPHAGCSDACRRSRHRVCWVGGGEEGGGRLYFIAEEKGRREGEEGGGEVPDVIEQPLHSANYKACLSTYIGGTTCCVKGMLKLPQSHYWGAVDPAGAGTCHKHDSSSLTSVASGLCCLRSRKRGADPAKDRRSRSCYYIARQCEVASYYACLHSEHRVPDPARARRSCGRSVQRCGVVSDYTCPHTAHHVPGPAEARRSRDCISRQCGVASRHTRPHTGRRVPDPAEARRSHAARSAQRCATGSCADDPCTVCHGPDPAEAR